MAACRDRPAGTSIAPSGSFHQMVREHVLQWAVTQAWYAPARRDSGRPDASTGQDMWWGCVRSGPG